MLVDSFVSLFVAVTTNKPCPAVRVLHPSRYPKGGRQAWQPYQDSHSLDWNDSRAVLHYLLFQSFDTSNISRFAGFSCMYLQSHAPFLFLVLFHGDKVPTYKFFYRNGNPWRIATFHHPPQ